MILIVNTLVVNEKHPFINRDNLTIPIQMQLSQRQETFSQFFSTFIKSPLSFEYFEKRNDPQRFCISDITDFENAVRKMSKNSRFRLLLDKKHGKRSQTLLKSASQHLYHIH